MKGFAVAISLLATYALARPQVFTTNTESDAGTTTCVTWTFPDGSVTTLTAGPGTGTAVATPTPTEWTCSCPARQTITTTVFRSDRPSVHSARAASDFPGCNCPGPVTTTIYVGPPRRTAA